MADLKDILREFLAESHEFLTDLDQELVLLEAHPEDDRLLLEVFRRFHSIKGTCGYFDLARLAQVSHKVEDVLMEVREGRLAVSPGLIGVLLESVDVMRAIVDAVEAVGTEPPGDDRGLMERLCQAETGQQIETVPRNVSTSPHDGDALPGITTAQASLRVDVGTLDQVLNRVEELVLIRNQLAEIAREDGTPKYAGPIQELSRVTSELQDLVMQTRMRPVSTVWTKLPRIVRDAAADLSKKVELVVDGETTELDRQVLNAIENPLVHMIRNSVDHGIEAPETRVSAGKAEHGTIRLGAQQRSGFVVIQVEDDGGGIDPERVRQKAMERQLVSAAEASAMSDSETLDLIFQPGFSTAAAVTEYSGRGVGMDVARADVEAIGGAVSAHSELGIGTTIQIRVPLTLAISVGLIVEAAGQTFAVPQTAILELLRIDPAAGRGIECVRNAAVMPYRDQLLTLLRLRDLLGFEARQGAEVEHVLVVQSDTCIFGLIVDRVFDTAELVLKQLSPRLADLKMYAGSAILGDGRVVLVLDAAGIVQHGRLDAPADLDALAHATRTGLQMGEPLSFLVLESGRFRRCALPLSYVSRIEKVPVSQIERVGDSWYLKYQGTLLQLFPVDANVEVGTTDPQPVVVLHDGRNMLGLMANQVHDISAATTSTEEMSTESDLLGTALINDQATGIIDPQYYFTRAFGALTPAAELKGLEILVVDDSAFFRNRIKTLIEAEGYRVRTAKDGQDALRVLESDHRIDVVLSDIEMPILNGFELADYMHEHASMSPIPIVAISSRSVAENQRADGTRRFRECLIKFDNRSLLRCLRDLSDAVLEVAA